MVLVPLNGIRLQVPALHSSLGSSILGRNARLLVLVLTSLLIFGIFWKWQRKLMPGGACEATVYCAFGYESTCVCLPLGNYHNQNEAKKKIDSETVAASDYDNLVKLLAALGQRLNDTKLAPPLKARLESLFASRRTLLATQKP